MDSVVERSRRVSEAQRGDDPDGDRDYGNCPHETNMPRGRVFRYVALIRKKLQRSKFKMRIQH